MTLEKRPAIGRTFKVPDGRRFTVIEHDPDNEETFTIRFDDGEVATCREIEETKQ